ncbi:MAG: hypothetical protein RLZZ414_261 [Bacteroidota bacterium]|jgi:UDP-N-acetylmuramoyl-tripeptide--D-alanyl-D-alanine ligase
MEIAHLHQLFLQSSGISIDTRKIFDKCLFFALKGANFDGNSFAQQAIQQGALYSVVDDSNLQNIEKCIYVNDVLQTLQSLATYHRKFLNIPIIALTGSNGKTTTKELLAAVLQKKYKVAYTQGNLNNHIGVPLTLLSIQKEHEIAVVEMGANHQKEIDFLCSIALPNYGLINNIGSAHLEGFGGLEGVRLGKTEMYKHLIAEDKLIFFNENEESLQVSLPNYPNIYKYGKQNVELLSNQSNTNGCLCIEVKVDEQVYKIQTQLFGLYNVQNVLTALAVGKYLNVPMQESVRAIEEYLPQNNRSQISQSKNGNALILDAYNANPNSMLNALKAFNELKIKDKFFIVGDMFELGDYAVVEHQKILDYVQENNLKGVFVGTHFSALQLPKDCRGFVNTLDAIDYFKNSPIQKQTILLKGSRGIGLEKLLEVI